MKSEICELTGCAHARQRFQSANANIRFQSFFMLITVHPCLFASLNSAWGKMPTLGTGQSLRWSVCIFALRIIVQNEHR